MRLKYLYDYKKIRRGKKKRYFLTVVLVLLASFSLAIYAQEERELKLEEAIELIQKYTEQEQELKAQIEALQLEISTLEQEIAKLESKLVSKGEILTPEIDKFQSKFSIEKFILLGDTRGNSVRVLVTESAAEPKRREILGIYYKIDPSYPGYFFVDVLPCQENGLVSIPGEVLEVNNWKDIECDNGTECTLQKITYRVLNNE